MNEIDPNEITEKQAMDADLYCSSYFNMVYGRDRTMDFDEDKPLPESFPEDVRKAWDIRRLFPGDEEGAFPPNYFKDEKAAQEEENGQPNTNQD